MDAGGIVTAAEVGRLARSRWSRWSAAADTPDAEAVLVPDTAMHTLALLPELEAAVGKPVLTANQVTVWEGLRLLGEVPACPAWARCSPRAAHRPIVGFVRHRGAAHQEVSSCRSRDPAGPRPRTPHRAGGPRVHPGHHRGEAAQRHRVRRAGAGHPARRDGPGPAARGEPRPAARGHAAADPGGSAGLHPQPRPVRDRDDPGERPRHVRGPRGRWNGPPRSRSSCRDPAVAAGPAHRGDQEDGAQRAAAGPHRRSAPRDIEFHQLLVLLAGSPRLSRMHDTLLTETRMCIHALDSTYTDPDGRVAEHQAIADAFAAGKPKLVDRLLVAHMDDAIVRLTHRRPPAPRGTGHRPTARCRRNRRRNTIGDVVDRPVRPRGIRSVRPVVLRARHGAATGADPAGSPVLPA